MLLAIAQGEDPYVRDTILLLDPGTGQRLELTDMVDAFGAGWGHDDRGLFIEYFSVFDQRAYTRATRIERLYVEDGTIVDLLSQTPTNTGLEARNGRYIARVSSCVPPDGMLRIPCPDIVMLVDTLSGTLRELEDAYPEEGLEHASVAWAPSGDLVAVTRSQWDLPLDMGSSLAIYSLSGDRYRSWNGLNVLGWAPDDSRRMLYLDGPRSWDATPCVLHVESGRTECLPEVAAWRWRTGVHQAGYRWTPGGEGISFLYWGYSPARAGVCRFSMTDMNITCPITEAVIPPGTFVRSYGWSPRGDFLWLKVSTTPPDGDFLLDLELLSASADGTNVRPWGSVTLDPASWRPEVSPQE